MKLSRYLQAMAVVVGCIILLAYAYYEKTVMKSVPAHIAYPSGEVYVEEEPHVKIEATYDKKAKLSKVVEYEYDELNRMKAMYEKYYDYEENKLMPSFTYKYSYDENNKYEKVVYHLCGNAEANCIYDNRGNETHHETWIDAGSNVYMGYTYDTKYEYTFKKGTVIRESFEKSYNDKVVKKTTIYDEKGNIIYEEANEKKKYSPVQKHLHTNVYEYDYDEKGNITHEIFKTEGLSWDIEYIYENDLLIKKYYKDTFHSKKNEECCRDTEYCYDSLNRLVREETRYKDGANDEYSINVLYYYNNISEEMIPLSKEE